MEMRMLSPASVAVAVVERLDPRITVETTVIRLRATATTVVEPHKPARSLGLPLLSGGTQVFPVIFTCMALPAQGVERLVVLVLGMVAVVLVVCMSGCTGSGTFR